MISPELSQTINSELRWRESELAIAKVHLFTSVHDGAVFRYSYRCFAMLTYAHYEAFTKRVIAQSMQDIFSSGCKWSACNRLVQIGLFSGGLRRMISTMSNEEIVQRGSSDVCIIDDVQPPSLDTIMESGNMNIANFFAAVSSVGLDVAPFNHSRRHIGQLVALRHHCAHGEALSLDASKTNLQLASELSALQDEALLLLHVLSVELVDHFNRGGYLA